MDNNNDEFDMNIEADVKLLSTRDRAQSDNQALR